MIHFTGQLVLVLTLQTSMSTLSPHCSLQFYGHFSPQLSPHFLHNLLCLLRLCLPPQTRTFRQLNSNNFSDRFLQQVSRTGFSNRVLQQYRYLLTPASPTVQVSAHPCISNNDNLVQPTAQIPGTLDLYACDTTEIVVILTYLLI